VGNAMVEQNTVNHTSKMAQGSDIATYGKFYADPFHNNPSVPAYYQGLVATVTFETTPSNVDVEKKVKNEVIMAMNEREHKDKQSLKNRDQRAATFDALHDRIQRNNKA
jgi:hypothetical protein